MKVSELSLGSEAHRKELDKEATSYVVAAQIAAKERDRTVAALQGVGGRASLVMPGPGRRVAGKEEGGG